MARAARPQAQAPVAPEAVLPEEAAPPEQVAVEGEAAEHAGYARVGFAPIVRVDAPRREVELCATSEALDRHGTVFDYEASKEAFTRWLGNVREMHERRAVGHRVGVRCDDAARRIFVTIRISRGAQDTWEKVLDGTLRGASIGASNVTWQRQTRRLGTSERWVDVATRYDLVELSLVDNPSNPDALGVTFVRDALPDLVLLDALGEEESVPAAPEAVVETPPESAPLPDAAHARLAQAARGLLAGCACPRCTAALAALHDEAAERRDDPLGGGPLARAMAAGLAASTAHLARLDLGIGDLREALRTLTTDLHETLGGLRHRVEAIEAQPLPGGPAARPVEKAHALAGAFAGQPTDSLRALEALAGRLSDPQAQVAVAAEVIRLQRAAE